MSRYLLLTYCKRSWDRENTISHVEFQYWVDKARDTGRLLRFSNEVSRRVFSRQPLKEAVYEVVNLLDL
jgi:hypothetical protein